MSSIAHHGRSADGSALPKLSLSSLSTLPPVSPPLTSNESHTSISVAPPEIAHDISIRQRSRNESTSTPPPSPPLSATDDRYPQEEETNSASPYHESLEPPLVHRVASSSTSAPYTSQEMDIAYSMVNPTQQQPESPQGQHRHDRTPLKLQPRPRAGGADVLSTLLKTGPIQEPYFRTRHTIASQHTLSTTRGVLFSLDEEPHEFDKDMYVAMRNRIFELEAKTVNYTPFNHSRKRVADWLMDEYYPYHEHGHGPAFVHGYDAKAIHHSKRAHRNDTYPQHHPSPAQHPPISTERIVPFRHPRSYPSWYTPEVNTFESYHQLYHIQHPSTFDRDRIQQRPGHSQVGPFPDHEPHLRSFAPADSTGARSALPAKHSLTMIKPRPTLPELASNGPEPSCHMHSSHGRNCSKAQSLQQCTGSDLPATSTTTQQHQRQSFHQRQHRAQQQAQSDYSRKYHLQKHLRMLDQQRVAQMAQQQQQQQQNFRILRQYEPHQQMRPASSKPQGCEVQYQEDAASNIHQTKVVQRYQQQNILQRTVGRSTVGSSSERIPTTVPSSTSMRDLGREWPSYQKSERPLECSNCMVLEPLESGPSSEQRLATSSKPALATANGKLLCPACMEHLQNHGKARSVLPFKDKFLKRIQSRLKRDLQEVRFHGWQDGRTLEIEDQMTEEDFRAVFRAGIGKEPVRKGPSSLSPASTSKSGGPAVINIEDDVDKMTNESSGQSPTEEVRFSSESSVGDLFGSQWKSEPMVGYTAVCFGGSEKIRMVPMNPTISALNVTFNKTSLSVVFAFRVLVNGLCLLSSGGGPPALHMPESVEDEEPEGEQGEQGMPEEQTVVDGDQGQAQE